MAGPWRFGTRAWQKIILFITMPFSLFLSSAAQYRVFLNVLADQLSLCLCLAGSLRHNTIQLTLRFSAASPDSKLIFQLSNPIMYFLSPVCMWEELRFCPARWGEPAAQLMFSLIWVGWLTPPGWAESMFLSHKMSGKIKTSQEIKYIMGLLSWNINFESGDAAEILTVKRWHEGLRLFLYSI